MRWVVILALLAGCTSPVTPETLPEHVYAVTDGCPLTLPAGADFDCLASDWQEVGSQRPALDSGWQCEYRYESELFDAELWAHSDGRIGQYWQTTRWKADGIQWQRLAIYDGADVGNVANTPFAESGWTEIPSDVATDRSVSMYSHAHQYRGFIQEDGAWRPAPEVTFHVNRWGPQFFVTAEVLLESGRYTIDVMMEREPDDDPYAWSLRPFEGTIDGHHILLSHMNKGAKYADVAHPSGVERVPGCRMLTD